jgi:hypothetical protein
MSLVRFEPTIPVFERAKMIHALDRAEIVIGRHYIMFQNSEFRLYFREPEFRGPVLKPVYLTILRI